MSISEAARRLGVSTKTVRRRIADGTLAAHRAPGPGGFAYRVTDAAVLVVQPGLDSGLDKRDNRERSRVDTAAVSTLAAMLSASEQARGRLTLELEQAHAEIARLRQQALPAPVPAPAPAPAPPVRPRRWWWPFGAR